MNARAATTYEYTRHLDKIFGRIEEFRRVKTHRIEVQIGRNYFLSSRTYTTAEAARQAAERFNAKVRP